MNNIMYSRYILTLAATIIIIMIDVLYFTKPKISDKTKHKMYALLISANTGILLIEIMVMLAFGFDLPFNICTIALQLRDLSMVLFFSSLLFYYYSAVNDKQYKNAVEMLKGEIFTSKKLLPHFIFTVIFIVVHLFLPYEYATKETINLAFGGLAFYATILYCVITTMETIFIILFVVRKKINFTERASLIWLFSLMIIILVFQPLFSDIAIMGLVSAIYVLGLYFLLENPDLEMVEQIESLTGEIEQTNHTKLDFLSNVSKEMVPPINAISTLSKGILTNTEIEGQELIDNIKQIEASSKEFLEVLDNAVDISNVENDQDKLYEANYSLVSVLNDLIDDIREKLVNKKIELIINIDNSIPNKLYGDSTKIFQIISNIISNAIKYTEVGKVTLTLSKEMKNSKVSLMFKISDTGIGIREEDYDKIFEKYSRLEDAIEKGIDGSGLGLAISKKYIDLLGGNIKVDSVYGAGSTFHVEIPQQIVELTPTVGNYKVREKKAAADISVMDCSKYRILIVEDDYMNLEVSKRLFGRYGFQIDTSTNGRDCIFKYKKGEQYDMILIDHRMPEMSGIDVIRVIRKLKDYKAPPVVAITANAFTGSKEMYIKEGFDDYLSKPIDLVELDLLIHKYFK